jgi:hypothetical protein
VSAVTLTVVVDGEVTTSARRPSESWEGFVAVDVSEAGFRSVATMYVTEDKARALIGQLTEALGGAPAYAEAMRGQA